MRVGKLSDEADHEAVTWQMCHLSGNSVSGFLDPYHAHDIDRDNLLEVPETIERCTVYNI